jgi:pyruvate-ferredoxin/flavodoxin oxidoreductase
LFEDNAEFGLGFRLAIDKHTQKAYELLEKLKHQVGDVADEILNATQNDEAEIFEQRKRVEKLNEKLKALNSEDALKLLELSEYLTKKSVWIIGGDGWAYDIGYGGLDHVFASGKNVNILVLDTQVYSNTGGQQSKATMTGAVAKFAAGGKPQNPKDLALMALAYGNVYVARVAMGADESQTIKAFIEAERYNGVSLIIAYSHCIAHGYDLRYGMRHQKLAVDAGLWATFRYDPSLENPMRLDYKGPKIDVKEFMYKENRFNVVEKLNPSNAEAYLNQAREYASMMYEKYKNL